MNSMVFSIGDNSGDTFLSNASMLSGKPSLGLGYTTRAQYREKIAQLESRLNETKNDLSKVRKTLEKAESKYTTDLRRRTEKIENGYRDKIDRLERQVKKQEIMINNNPNMQIDMSAYRKMQETETKLVRKIAALEKSLNHYKGRKSYYKKKYKDTSKKYKALKSGPISQGIDKGEPHPNTGGLNMPIIAGAGLLAFMLLKKKG